MDVEASTRFRDQAEATVQRKGKQRDRFRPRGFFRVVCKDKRGRLKWVDRVENLVVDEGCDEILDKFWKGSGYTAAHYVGLTDGTPTVAAGDTMSSHAGWAEVTAYDEAARQTFTPGAVSSKSVDNSGSPAVFTCSTNGTTVGGLFISTNSTKGGSSGVLIAAVAFSVGDKSLDDGDTLTVTYTSTCADDGA